MTLLTGQAATVRSAAAVLPAPDVSDRALARITARLAETAEHYDRTAEFPWQGIQAVHEAGLLSLDRKSVM